WIFGCKLNDVTRRANHNFAFEGQLPNKRAAESRLAYISAHNKRADRADIHDTELVQLLSDQGRLTSIGPADVYRTKKNDRRHFSILESDSNKRRVRSQRSEVRQKNR